MALATDHAVQIFGAEHFSRAVQPWTCAAAPIHDPETGEVLGAVDITGGSHLASPQSLALVQATARAAEAELATLRRGQPGNGARLRALGRDEAILEVGGARHRLGRRHSEILVLLAAHPEGLSNERLAWELYGERLINPVTLRAELSRLRQLLGRLFQSRPYRLTEPMAADFRSVIELVRGGSIVAALRTYAGPLLPGSESPGVLRLRGQLDDLVRDAVLQTGDYAMLERWATSPSGEDDLARPGSRSWPARRPGRHGTYAWRPGRRTSGATSTASSAAPARPCSTTRPPATNARSVYRPSDEPIKAPERRPMGRYRAGGSGCRARLRRGRITGECAGVFSNAASASSMPRSSCWSTPFT